jgi:hypothetical protein
MVANICRNPAANSTQADIAGIFPFRRWKRGAVVARLPGATWQGGTALESSEKQWFLSFPDRLEARDSQTGGVKLVVAGKDSCDGLSQGGQPVARIFKKKSVVGRWC